MEHFELLENLAKTLEHLGLRYVVVGSTASVLHGEPRFTNDIDVVVELQPVHLELLLSAFPPPDFYLSRSAAEAAIRQRSQFNIIHPASGLKIDCIVSKGDSFDQIRFSRAQAIIPLGGSEQVSFATAEDVILKKMEYFRLGESEKHIRDICGILITQGDRLDVAYIREWAARLGLTDIWIAIQERMKPG